VDAEEEGVEVEAPGPRDHDLAVHHGAIRERSEQRRRQLREVALQRPQVAALQEELVAIPEDDAAEAIPFRLVCPAVALREGRLRGGEHRLEGWDERQAHRRIMRREARGMRRLAQAGS